jgi:hypothetical protein
VNTKLRPLTGVGLQLFRGWLYAPFSVAFGAIGIGIFTSPHLDKVGIGMALAILAIGLAYVLWTRRIEKTFGQSLCPDNSRNVRANGSAVASLSHHEPSDSHAVSSKEP